MEAREAKRLARDSSAGGFGTQVQTGLCPPSRPYRKGEGTGARAALGRGPVAPRSGGQEASLQLVFGHIYSG